MRPEMERGQSRKQTQSPGRRALDKLTTGDTSGDEFLDPIFHLRLILLSTSIYWPIYWLSLLCLSIYLKDIFLSHIFPLVKPGRGKYRTGKNNLPVQSVKSAVVEPGEPRRLGTRLTDHQKMNFSAN